jgi:hypothetical protein
MNCKYCGHALPTKGGACPGCGKMIPISQQKEMKQMLDPRWNQFRSMDTAFYKSASNNDSLANDKKLGNIIVIGVAVIILFIIIMAVKGAGN